ncbi:MAG: VanZ family protein [Vicinamibacterales bacterium]|nr:VanZ family protein [Vicinamibacterales bacterium]
MTERAQPPARVPDVAVHAGWLAARLLFLAGLFTYLFVGQEPEKTRFWDTFFNTGHAPLFGLAALVIRSLLASEAHLAGVWRTSAVAFGVALAAGAATELIQVFLPSRDASLIDLARDAAGAGAFLMLWSLYLAWRRPGTAPTTAAGRAGIAAVAVLALLAAGGHLLFTTAAYAGRNRAFPLLFPADGAWWQEPFVSTRGASLSPAPAFSGHGDGPWVRLDLRPGRYSGLELVEPFPDWRNRTRLVFAIVSEMKAPLNLELRVHDRDHNRRFADRFNRTLTIVPGENRIIVNLDDVRQSPGRRQMDLARIRSVMLFVTRLAGPARVYVGPMRLE